METRESIDSACCDPYLATGGGEKISDYGAADDSSGFVYNMFMMCLKVATIAIIVFGVAAMAAPYLTPKFYAKYKSQLLEMGIAANTGRFIKNAADINWMDVISDKESFFYVGTGKHPFFKKNPELRKDFTYIGDGVLIRKNYINDLEYIEFTEGLGSVPEDADMAMPASNIEHEEAQRYCNARKGRLPYDYEIKRALAFFNMKDIQGKAGEFLKPNLSLNITSQFKLWTSTPQGDSYTEADNYLLYQRGATEMEFKDDGYQNDDLSFLCVIDVKKEE